MDRAERDHDRTAIERSVAEARDARAELGRVREGTVALLKRADPAAQTNDTNYVFLGFVLTHLPVGLIGLVFAAVFAASMNSTSAELNALTSTTVVDVVRRLPGHRPDERRDVWMSRLVTLLWAGFAVAFADRASHLGTLVEAVNILGSLFYGTILGIFLTAFLLRRVGGTAVFSAAVIAEAAVIACFRLTTISFLWYNLIGCALVMAFALLIQALLDARRPSMA
jgi:Na+/proline symporter